jgi:hypothetical protein
MRVQKGLIGLIVILQTVLFLTHFLVHETWTFSPVGSGNETTSAKIKPNFA